MGLTINWIDPGILDYVLSFTWLVFFVSAVYVLGKKIIS